MSAELQESARKVLSGLGVPADEAQTWRHIVELGWLLVAVPEELGGLGECLAGACALYRELGASLAAAPFLPAMLAIDALCQAGQTDWVERAAAGEYVCAPLAETALSATRDGTLTGLAPAVPCADKAGHVVLWTDECVALVPLDHPGVAIQQRPTWDTTRRLFDIRLDGVDGLVLVRGADAEALSRRLSAHRDVALAADSVGGATALLDQTVEYLMTRRQFGRPLAMFQALKHRCADLKAVTAAAEALLLDGLDRPDDALFGLQAKSFATASYARVAEEALQLHGGIGMTAEYSCHLFLKRALLNVQLGRPNDSCDLAIAGALL